MTRFFGQLFLINFALGVATGIVQEFQFGMNWSVYSKYVGNVFGAPLAIEGLAAFFLESTFLGLWIFGWNRLSPRVHLATIWLATLGTWLSAYFILVANSWMQHPVGSKVENGQAVLTSVWSLLSATFALWAFGHTMFAALTVGSVVVLGVSCWQLARNHEVEVFRRSAKLALIVLVPVAAVNLWFGSHFGIYTTEQQPMKIASTEAQWDTCTGCAFSLFQIGGFTKQDQTPSFSIEIPKVLSFLATGSFNGTVQGITPLQAKNVAQYGRGNYMPAIETVYWSMRVMAYLGTLVFLVAAVGAFLYRRRKLVSARWFHWVGVTTIAFPFLAALAGWVLTEVGRQPRIVQGLLKTADANSPSVSTATIAVSLAVFVSLYVILAVVDFVLMRHFARLDPSEPELDAEGALPALSY